MRIFGFAGGSGSGKTTLIEQLIPRLKARGLVVSLIKEAHRKFDVDQPGNDSWRHRRAGCTEVLLTGGNRWALMHELRGAGELSLDGALARLSPCDLVLVEGFKASPIPKIEVWRAEVPRPSLHPGDPHILAFATDSPEALGPTLNVVPIFDLGDHDTIATFVMRNSCPA